MEIVNKKWKKKIVPDTSWSSLFTVCVYVFYLFFYFGIVDVKYKQCLSKTHMTEREN